MKEKKRILSKEKILSVAINIADEKGIQSLSMRKLADKLNVKAMSLYNHIQNKEELINEMVDFIFGEFHFHSEKNNWKRSIRLRSQSMYRVLLKHPWAAMTILPRMCLGKNFFSFYEASLACLRSAAGDLGKADQVLSIIDNYIYGFIIQKLTFPVADQDFQQTADDFIHLIDKERYPNFFDISQQVQEGSLNPEQNFEMGLSIVLSGIDAYLNSLRRLP